MDGKQCPNPAPLTALEQATRVFASGPALRSVPDGLANTLLPSRRFAAMRLVGVIFYSSPGKPVGLNSALRAAGDSTRRVAI
ncbi:hypothetical protein SAMN05518800_7034 [Variovorax sp. YR752]|nr:hypothetical protein SAMN05518800_7034 [Variovorax sp. YR752]